MPSRDSTPLVIAVLVLAAAVAYAGSFAGTWISDDVDTIAPNPVLRSLTWANLRTLATERTDGTNYIPLNFLSLAIDRQIWGPNPWGFHFTNLAFHVANAIVIFFLLLRLQESRGIAAAASLLWLLHPVQVESVAWISERKNVLSTLFFVLAFLEWLRFSERPTPWRYVLVLLFYLSALVSKVNTIVLPVLFLVCEIALHRRLRMREVLLTVPMFAIGALIAWANLHDNPSHGVAYHGGSLEVTLRTSATTIPRYWWNVVAPFDLSTYYPVPLRASWIDPTVAGAVAFIVALVALTLWLAAHGHPEAFWLAWFGITLAPMLNLVPFPALMNDRYLYIPLLGALVPLLRLGARLLARVGAHSVGPALVGAIALGLGILTVWRVPAFRTPLSLWADMGLRTPYITSDQPYGPAARTEEKRLLTEALTRHPTRAALHNNLGGFAFEENRLTDALPFLERAHQLDPNDPAIALNLGRTYLWLRRIDEARRTLQLATTLEPPSFFAHLNLARAYMLQGDLRAARAELEIGKTLKKDPWFWQGFEQQLERAERRGS